jgi:hypothetical protein
LENEVRKLRKVESDWLDGLQQFLRELASYVDASLGGNGEANVLQ